jgi:transcriptional regulator with XRE-family HTH domain
MKFKSHTCPRCHGTGKVYSLEGTGATLRALRERAGISLRRMARRLEVSSAMLSKWELGEAKMPNARVEQFLSEVAQTSPSDAGS